MSRDKDFTGIWHIRYWYQSSVRKGEFTSEYYAQLRQKGNQLILESLGNTEGSYLLVRLTVDGQVATGTWHEETSPRRFHEGITYHGALQLVLNKDGERMEGCWVGVGRDMKVNEGVWEITHAGHKANEAPAQRQPLSVKA